MAQYQAAAALAQVLGALLQQVQHGRAQVGHAAAIHPHAAVAAAQGPAQGPGQGQEAGRTVVVGEDEQVAVGQYFLVHAHDREEEN